MRSRRAAWARELKRRYAPEAVAWADTAAGNEKAAAVTLLHPASSADGLAALGADPIIVVAFRGSKQATSFE